MLHLEGTLFEPTQTVEPWNKMEAIHLWHIC